MSSAMLPLFPNLPPPAPRPAPEAEVPESVRELLDAGFPGEAVERLYEYAGGFRVPVPKEARPDHPLVLALGEEAAGVLCRLRGGGCYQVPSGYRGRISARNAAIRRDYDEATRRGERGVMALLVRRYGVTERQVRAVLGQEG